jgi:glutaminase
MRESVGDNLAHELADRIRSLWRNAIGVIFEDGIPSNFSRGLIDLVITCGEDARVALAEKMIHEQIHAEVIAEALRWFGQIEHQPSSSWRLWMLQCCLNSKIGRIRDGALIGLALMDDPISIATIQQAIEREPIEELRADMRQVLAQLQDSIKTAR